MKKFLKGTLTALVLGSVAQADPIVCYDPCVIGQSDGGIVSQFEAQGRALKHAGTLIVVDGPCLSACTILLDQAPAQVCVTREASLGFHQERFAKGGLEGEDFYEEISYKTPGLNAWIAAQGGLPKGPFLMMSYEVLVKFFRACPERSRFKY